MPNLEIKSTLKDLDKTWFLEEYWQKKPLLIRGALPGFEPELTPEELAGIACDEHVESRIVTRSPEPPHWHVKHGPFTDADFLELPENEWTLLVQDAEKHLPDLAAIFDEFAFIPSWRIDDLMISYASDRGSVGPHVDAYDVFLLQADGTRCWEINTEKNNFATAHGIDLKVLSEFSAEVEWLVEPGDILYLPPGIPHYGVAHGPCTTWSIGFRTASLQEMLPDFCEWVLRRRAKETRYADADLTIEEVDGGKISARAIQRMRDIIEGVWEETGPTIEEWFGCFVTEPKHWLRAQPPKETLDGEEIAAGLKSGKTLFRNTMSLFAHTIGSAGELFLFVDGECYKAEPESAQFVNLLCSRRRFSHSDLGSHLTMKHVRDLLYTLYNKGAVYFLHE
ncbi:MAG: AraC family ligand binding domain-containing protein [Gammaproteobacteria bacterium]|nr:AraC family ligand binding domain-containing protein [Gammaproteobacteria bacterium]